MRGRYHLCAYGGKLLCLHGMLRAGPLGHHLLTCHQGAKCEGWSMAGMVLQVIGCSAPWLT